MLENDPQDGEAPPPETDPVPGLDQWQLTPEEQERLRAAVGEAEAPPASAAMNDETAARLRELTELEQAGLITRDEYGAARQGFIDSL